MEHRAGMVRGEAEQTQQGPGLYPGLRGVIRGLKHGRARIPFPWGRSSHAAWEAGTGAGRVCSAQGVTGNRTAFLEEGCLSSALKKTVRGSEDL